MFLADLVGSDRGAQRDDRFGHRWSIATRVQDATRAKFPAAMNALQWLHQRIAAAPRLVRWSERMTALLGPRAAPGPTGLQITGMTCAFCVARVERALMMVQGAAAASVNLATERATVEAPASVSVAAWTAIVETAGYGASDVHRAVQAETVRVSEGGWLLLSMLWTLPLMAPMLLSVVGIEAMPPPWLQWAMVRAGARWCALVGAGGRWWAVPPRRLAGRAQPRRQHGFTCRARHFGGLPDRGPCWPRHAAFVFRGLGCVHHAGAAWQMAGRLR